MKNYQEKHTPVDKNYELNKTFPEIKMPDTKEIINLSKRFCKKKAFSFDGISEKLIQIKKMSNIREVHKKIKFLKSIFDPKLLNSEKMKQCFVGRPIPTRKVKGIGDVNGLRPIGALSPIAKFFEYHLRNQLENEIHRRCSISQI